MEKRAKSVAKRAEQPSDEALRSGRSAISAAKREQPRSDARQIRDGQPGVSNHSPFAGVEPQNEALEIYRRGMEALQHHAFATAATAFRSLADRFPAERALLDRARVYLNLCERELRGQSIELTTVEERLTAATAALNQGENDRAESLAGTVLSVDQNNDIALYLMAAASVRQGQTDRAMDLLGRAASVNGDVRVQAQLDADFAPLRHLEAFHALTHLSAPSATRPARQTRPER
jgi:tetratricopeptide (TPR) repeat protein